jgi:hypothetical protein
LSFTRLIASVCAAAIVLLVAFPAAASAPRCDSRGAITFAPPPKLDEPNVSVDRTPSASCLEALLDKGTGYERGRAPAPEASASNDVAPAGFQTLVLEAYAGELTADPIFAPVIQEHRFTLERPPRI